MKLQIYLAMEPIFFPGGFYTIRISAKKCCSRTNNLDIFPLFKFGEEYYLLIIEVYDQNYWVGQNKLFGRTTELMSDSDGSGREYINLEKRLACGNSS